MSHIDTLKVYEEYKATGLNDHQAREYTNILENSFMTKVQELKSEFVNNKLTSIIGGLILLVGVGSIGLLWRVTVDLEIMKSDIQSQSAQIQQLSMKDNKIGG